ITADVIVLPTASPNHPPSNLDSTPPTTQPVHEIELMPELSCSASELPSMPNTTLNNTSAQ
uniref:Uncharacterized protein n=1 Tax=Panagrolaimus sp. PS1159 TaxID=55785 RepID=A0AC35EWI9_9BILA